MEKIITWRAFDGEEFNSEEDCKFHEEHLLEVMRLIIFYKNGQVIPFETMDDMEVAYNECDTIRIKRTPNWREDLEFLDTWWGWLLPVEPGLYQYDFDDLQWLTVEEREEEEDEE